MVISRTKILNQYIVMRRSSLYLSAMLQRSFEVIGLIVRSIE